MCPKLIIDSHTARETCFSATFFGSNLTKQKNGIHKIKWNAERGKNKKEK